MANKLNRYTISGMHCGGCVAKVEKALNPFAGKVEVSLDPPRVLLEGNHATVEELNRALALVGDYRLEEEPPIPAAAAPAPAPSTAEETGASWFATYRPLLLIIGYILLTTLAIQAASGAFDGTVWMIHFMAGFFLVFSFFKMLNLRDFANSYAMYDLLAMRWHGYGYIYPFIELGLGVAYVLHWQPFYTNLATFFVMSFSSLGVIRAVASRQKIRCACLGAVFNLPMSTVTIIEDVLMAAMAGWMLLRHLG